MNKIKILLFALAMTLSVTSCLEEEKLTTDKPVNPQSLLDMQKYFVKATNGLTPLTMGKDEWALYKIEARLYTGQFQGLGYKTAQALSAENNIITVEGKDYNTRNLNIVVTDYKEPTNEQEQQNPIIDVQKEWNCKFVKPPYWIWYGECSLPMEQNLILFQGLSEPSEPIFFDPKMYTKKEKLPKKMVDEGRCYNFENCELDVTYLEYDIWGKGSDGENKRIHYVTSFSGELPYLASNIKTCYTTVVEVNNNEHPAEVCQTLVDFQPGIASPAYCPDNYDADPEHPCVESSFTP